MKASTKVAQVLLEMRCVLQLYHWKTDKYAYHVAVDKLLDEITTLGDKLIESLIARDVRPSSIHFGKIKAHSDKSFKKYLIGTLKFWNDDYTKMFSEASDLLSIRDEIVASINRALYLLAMS